MICLTTRFRYRTRVQDAAPWSWKIQGMGHVIEKRGGSFSHRGVTNHRWRRLRCKMCGRPRRNALLNRRGLRYSLFQLERRWLPRHRERPRAAHREGSRTFYGGFKIELIKSLKSRRRPFRMTRRHIKCQGLARYRGWLDA